MKTFQRLHLGSLIGIKIDAWCRLLYDNQFSLSVRSLPRVFIITMISFLNSFLGMFENLFYSSRILNQEIEPPAFILGFPRSGTTYLFHLLSQDNRFSFPNLFEVRNPHTFLLLEKFLLPVLNRFYAPKRLQDNVAISMKLPDEDEFATALISLRSALFGIHFPKRRSRYEVFYTFENADIKDVMKWKQALIWFMKKLTLKSNRPLLLKSPVHTGRIRYLLELFPNAKFLFIHRHPYDVYLSFKHTAETVWPVWQLQKDNNKDIDSFLLKRFDQTFKNFFADREKIPSCNYVEIRFTDLVENPIGEMRKVYQSFEWNNFNQVQPQMQKYVNSLATFKQNRYGELENLIKLELKERCPRYFLEWKYSFD
jgi:hypothetical protein